MNLRRLTPSVCLLALLAACGDPQAESAGTGTTDGTGGPDSTGTDPTTGTSSDVTGPEPTTSTTDPGTTGDPEPPPEPEAFSVLQDIVFYDGYAGTVDEPIPEGVIRHRNDLVATRFGDDMLAKIQTTLTLGVIVGALCDNYDRIGAVHLALVPKGAQTYDPAEVDRLEVARFITPFMDMNKHPMTVPYEWQASNLVPILKDPELLAEYDFWFELMIFGVPYAANEEVAGCAGRNDTQLGTLLLYTDSKQPAPQFDTLVPVAIGQEFNNYAEGASDELGTTRKTVTFELPADTANAQLVLITSNHGANAGGEEYIRRDHFVYLDGKLLHVYKPGRPTCEPFRVYNTQPNGIYGPYKQSDEAWQSFSNWCPGDVIDTRILPWGSAKAGPHEFVIEVPDATFADNQGNFPFSLYVQAE